MLCVYCILNGIFLKFFFYLELLVAPTIHLYWVLHYKIQYKARNNIWSQCHCISLVFYQFL
jgi:hypothetical protein